ncbi:MAG: hypothetical protein WBD01_08670 [Salaquimonas sp.]
MGLTKLIAGTVVVFGLVGIYQSDLISEVTGNKVAGDPRNAYDGTPYSGSDFQLSAEENDYYMHCRNELVRFDQYFLTASAETGCACIADNLSVNARIQGWDMHKAMLTYKRHAEKYDQAEGGFRIPIVKFAKDFNLTNRHAKGIYDSMREVEHYCTPPKQKLDLSGATKPNGERNVQINRSGKTQTATFVDDKGNKRTVTVPGSKGMIIMGTKDGVVVKPR